MERLERACKDVNQCLTAIDHLRATTSDIPEAIVQLEKELRYIQSGFDEYLERRQRIIHVDDSVFFEYRKKLGQREQNSFGDVLKRLQMHKENVHQSEAKNGNDVVMADDYRRKIEEINKDLENAQAIYETRFKHNQSCGYLEKLYQRTGRLRMLSFDLIHQHQLGDHSDKIEDLIDMYLGAQTRMKGRTFTDEIQHLVAEHVKPLIQETLKCSADITRASSIAEEMIKEGYGVDVLQTINYLKNTFEDPKKYKDIDRAMEIDENVLLGWLASYKDVKKNVCGGETFVTYMNEMRKVTILNRLQEQEKNAKAELKYLHGMEPKDKQLLGELVKTISKLYQDIKEHIKILNTAEKVKEEEIQNAMVTLRECNELIQVGDKHGESFTTHMDSIVQKVKLDKLQEKINKCYIDVCNAIELSNSKNHVKDFPKLKTRIMKLKNRFTELKPRWESRPDLEDHELLQLVENYEEAVECIDADSFTGEVKQRIHKREEKEQETKLKEDAEGTSGKEKKYRKKEISKKEIETKSEAMDLEEAIDTNHGSEEKSVDDRPTLEILGSSQCIRKGIPSIYQVKTQMLKDNSTIKQIEIGRNSNVHVNKVIMLIGATGAGKTTLINAMFNYVVGTKWKDDFRFQMTQKEQEIQDQTRSQTKKITKYTLHYRNGFNIAYNLTIIDTPGYGDTMGLDRDRKITQDINTFFNTKGENGIDAIDAVAFVIQSNLPRLTPTQKYIFDSILSLFGRDITDNIFLMLTFSDGHKPQVLSSIEHFNLPHENFFKFNNSALYTNKLEEADGEEVEGFDELFWKMGMQSFEDFFSALNKVEKKSLTLTKSTLRERQQLEAYVEGIQTEIDLQLNRIEQLRVEADYVKKHESDILRNRNFRYQVDEDSVEMHQIRRGEYTTNCTVCKRTCHYPCAYGDDYRKGDCQVMDVMSGRCRICPGKCHWKMHRNLKYKYIIRRKAVWKQSTELMQRYRQALGERCSANDILTKLKEDGKASEKQILKMVESLRESLEKLAEISLKPTKLTKKDILEKMVSSEESEMKPGWKERISEIQRIISKV